MVLTDYIFRRFSLSLVGLSLLLGIFVLSGQLFSIFYLIFSLPPLTALSYLFMLLVYTLTVSMALSLPLVGANTVYTFKERRIFHVLYTFGISEREVLKRFWTAVSLFAVGGALASLLVNYQKISHLTKYLKFKFSEKVLLTVPQRSFATFENLSVYFEKKEGEKFKRIIVHTGEDLAVAGEAKLLPEGILKLKDCSVFARQNEHRIYMESKTYTVSLVDRYTYVPPKRKFLKETVFSLSLYLLSVFFFPIIFYTVLKRAESRFKALLWGTLFMFFQFTLALIFKGLV